MTKFDKTHFHHAAFAVSSTEIRIMHHVVPLILVFCPLFLLPHYRCDWMTGSLIRTSHLWPINSRQFICPLLLLTHQQFLSSLSRYTAGQDEVSRPEKFQLISQMCSFLLICSSLSHRLHGSHFTKRISTRDQNLATPEKANASRLP